MSGFQDAYLIPGWCYPRELDALHRLVKGSECHVEIGSFCGKSLYASCLALDPQATVFAVDRCTYDNIFTPNLYVPDSQWVKKVLDATIESIQLKQPHMKITHLVGDSMEAAYHIQKLDIRPNTVYIDGDHNYAEVHSDIMNWYSLLAPGGRIIGHDFWAANPGVIDAVEELFDGKFSVESETRIWHTTKPLIIDEVPIPLRNLVVSQY